MQSKRDWDVESAPQHFPQSVAIQDDPRYSNFSSNRATDPELGLPQANLRTIDIQFDGEEQETEEEPSGCCYCCIAAVDLALFSLNLLASLLSGLGKSLFGGIAISLVGIVAAWKLLSSGQSKRPKGERLKLALYWRNFSIILLLFQFCVCFLIAYLMHDINPDRSSSSLYSEAVVGIIVSAIYRGIVLTIVCVCHISNLK